MHRVAQWWCNCSDVYVSDAKRWAVGGERETDYVNKIDSIYTNKILQVDRDTLHSAYSTCPQFSCNTRYTYNQFNFTEHPTTMNEQKRKMNKKIEQNKNIPIQS